MIDITVNGQTESVEEGTVVRDLIERFKLSPKAVIVECNGTVLKASEREHHPLSSGDRLELIQIVGGG